MNRVLEIVIWPFRWLYVLGWWRWRGWDLGASLPELDKYIIIGAPHTSNWDYAHFLAGAAQAGRRPRVTIKKELFFPPLSWVLYVIGSIPIDRKGSVGLVEQLTEQLNTAERLVFVFTPEGTRSYRDHWKTGFYHIAVQAEVPIVMAALNYPDKRVYISEPFYPTGDIQADFEAFRAYYAQNGIALHPEKANDVRLRRTNPVPRAEEIDDAQ